MHSAKTEFFTIYKKLIVLSEDKYKALLNRDLKKINESSERIQAALEPLRSDKYLSVIEGLSAEEKEQLVFYAARLKQINERNRAIIESSMGFISYMFETMSQERINTYSSAGTYKAGVKKTIVGDWQA